MEDVDWDRLDSKWGGYSLLYNKICHPILKLMDPTVFMWGSGGGIATMQHVFVPRSRCIAPRFVFGWPLSWWKGLPYVPCDKIYAVRV